MKPAKNGQDAATQPSGVRKYVAKVSVDVVFTAPPEFADAVKKTCEDLQSDKLQDCFATEMKKAKATPAAAEFSKQLGEPGFVRDFKVAGAVDIAYVFYPYRANENQSCLIVNGDPAVIDVDNHKLVGAGALKFNSTYVALSKNRKEVSLWPGDRYGTETPDVEMGSMAGAHIIVNYRLREECHACAVLGHAWYSFDFDAKGKFLGAKLFGVSVAREKAAIFRDAKKSLASGVGEEFTIALPMKGAAASEWALAKALDSGKLRLIEHSRVAPPTGSGGAGTQELWKFAALGAGATTVEFQNGAEKAKAVVFRVAVRGRAASEKN
ncbi:MAG: protease inhibitor I42 family protein [Candidatus Acidiferrum sp.]